MVTRALYAGVVESAALAGVIDLVCPAPVLAALPDIPDEV
jgi:hypothetical protein